MKRKIEKNEHVRILFILSIYVLFSTLWIYLSDRLLFMLIIDPYLKNTVSLFKGIVFILLSAALLYPLILRYAESLKEAGEALRASEERFRLIADSMPTLVWTARPDGVIDYINRMFKVYTGLAMYEGEHAGSGIVHPEDRPVTIRLWQESMRSGISYEVEHRLLRHDGAYRWHLCRAIPVKDASGAIIQWYGNSTDIHDLKTAHERIAGILESTSDGFIAIDRQWRITYFNRKAEEMSGLRGGEILGKSYWDVMPNSVNTKIETEYRLAMEEKQSAHFEEYYERYGRLLDVYVHPYADGIAIFFHDLSDRERAAEALRSRTAELESLLANAPIGFAFFDREHRFLRMNKALAEINGIPEEESLGKTIRDLLPMNALTVDPILDQVFETGHSVESEISGETPRLPGVTRFWLTGFFPVFAHIGAPLAVGGYVVEITERKRAEEAMARLAAIVEGAEDAIYSEDLHGIIQTWNAGAAKLYGYAPHEVIGKHVSLLVPEEHRGELEELTRKMREGIQDHFETTRITKSGQRIIASLTMSPIKDTAGRIVGVSKLVHDITNRKKTEENLKETVRALERSNRELRQFAYVASHDLQEPLRNVTRYVELLSLRYRELLDDKAKRYVEFAVEGAARIHALINDLIAFSEVGAQVREFKAVSMQAVAEEAVDNLRELIEQHDAEVTLATLPEIVGDRVHLVQLVQNLVGNAVKFGRKDVAPQVRLTANREAGEWRFGVHDNGIGISSEYFEKVFVIFQRLHPRSEYPGTGIGLAICRKIVEWHGGKIWIESAVGEGTTFYFTIPIRGEIP